jgi:hypothetical protein
VSRGSKVAATQPRRRGSLDGRRASGFGGRRVAERADARRSWKARAPIPRGEFGLCDPRRRTVHRRIGAPKMCRPHASVLAATASEYEARAVSRHAERRRTANPLVLRTSIRPRRRNRRLQQVNSAADGRSTDWLPGARRSTLCVPAPSIPSDSHESRSCACGRPVSAARSQARTGGATRRRPPRTSRPGLPRG